jgi:hypothetical protein
MPTNGCPCPIDDLHARASTVGRIVLRVIAAVVVGAPTASVTFDELPRF